MRSRRDSRGNEKQREKMRRGTCKIEKGNGRETGIAGAARIFRDNNFSRPFFIWHGRQSGRAMISQPEPTRRRLVFQSLTRSASSN